MHDPEQAAARAQARKRGGERRRAPHAGDPSAIPSQVRSANGVLAILDYALAETLVLENSVPRTRALIALGMLYLTVYPRATGEQAQERYDQDVARYGINFATDRLIHELQGHRTQVVEQQPDGTVEIDGKKLPMKKALRTMASKGYKVIEYGHMPRDAPPQDGAD